MNTPQQQEPTTLLQGKPWVPPDQTDVQKTWRKFGWRPTHPPQNDDAYEHPQQTKGD
jgi:hypothetical protein